MSTREEYEAERMNDRDIYHGGPDGSQRREAGVVGICDPKDESLLFCVGCNWCSPDFETWAIRERRATA